MNSQKVCSLWGTDEKAMLADAILYNSCLIHGMDYDDTHVGSIIHPCSGSQYSIYSRRNGWRNWKADVRGHCSRLGDHRPAGTGSQGQIP